MTRHQQSPGIIVALLYCVFVMAVFTMNILELFIDVIGDKTNYVDSILDIPRIFSEWVRILLVSSLVV